jgi:hypothetical protein
VIPRRGCPIRPPSGYGIGPFSFFFFVHFFPFFVLLRSSAATDRSLRHRPIPTLPTSIGTSSSRRRSSRPTFPPWYAPAHTHARERTIIITALTQHTAHTTASHNKQKSELSTDMIDPSFTGEDATLSVTDNVQAPPPPRRRVLLTFALFFFRSFVFCWCVGLTSGIGAVQGRAGQLRWVHLRRPLQPQVVVAAAPPPSHLAPANNHHFYISPVNV